MGTPILINKILIINYDTLVKLCNSLDVKSNFVTKTCHQFKKHVPQVKLNEEVFKWYISDTVREIYIFQTVPGTIVQRPV